MKILFVIYIGAFFAGVKSTIVNNCTISSAPPPLEVDIKECDQSPCTFYIGNSGVMSMKFRAPRYLEKIKPHALATVMGANITYPLNENDACVGVTNTPCPLAEGELVEYTYSMFILSIFPPISLTLEFALVDVDQNNEEFVCFKTELQLAKP